MTSIGVPAVAGDTGGAPRVSRARATSETAREAQRAPGTRTREANAIALKSKPGRSPFTFSALAAPPSWFAPLGPNGPCSKCRAKLVALLAGGERIRVLHEKGCGR